MAHLLAKPTYGLSRSVDAEDPFYGPMDAEDAIGQTRAFAFGLDFKRLRLANNYAKESQRTTAREKILHQVRCAREYRHRAFQYARSAHTPMTVNFSVCQPAGKPDLWHALDCFNKSTALYIFDSHQLFPYKGAMAIDVWLYRRWFRPYITDIEFNRYFAKVFAVQYDARSSHKIHNVDELIALHCNVCEQSSRAADAAGQRDSTQSPIEPTKGPLRLKQWDFSCSTYSEKELVRKDWRRTHILQPLFRAVFMVLVPNPHPWKPWLVDRVKDVAKLKVQLVLTDHTEGLSGPIEFPSSLMDYKLAASDGPGYRTVTTTFERATDFIMQLEQREMAAFGIQPEIRRLDPESTRFWQCEAEWLEHARRLGWDEERDGALDKVSERSSTWLDSRRFPLWTGDGAEEALTLAQKMVERTRAYSIYPHLSLSSDPPYDTFRPSN
ncbi:hypothetical protein F4677DRAFT_376163 [Hypoxylon crocopeplum]|nr:hypothetical protein F4677DRAFT_376163 [Hypoxylon crocopeplum]